MRNRLNYLAFKYTFESKIQIIIIINKNEINSLSTFRTEHEFRRVCRFPSFRAQVRVGVKVRVGLGLGLVLLSFNRINKQSMCCLKLVIKT